MPEWHLALDEMMQGRAIKRNNFAGSVQSSLCHRVSRQM